MTGPADVWAELAPLPVSVELDPVREVTYASFAVAGLRQLADRRLIDGLHLQRVARPHTGELELREGGWTSTGGRPRKTAFATVSSAGRSQRVAFDYRDSATIFAADALDGATTVFKRSFRPDVADAARTVRGTTVLPGGLSVRVGCEAAADRRAILVSMLATGALEAVRPDRGALRRLRASTHDAASAWRAWPAQWQVDRLRALRPSFAGGQVVFQTRSFGPQEDDDPDCLAIHQQRAALIRTLRGELGPRFQGGFIADPMTRARYRDCLTDIPSDRHSYGAAIAGAAVVVSTRGLVDSIPHKLPEYQAFGKCIVAEATDQVLPGPFRGTFASFETLDGCIEQVTALLADQDRRAALATAAHDYYQRWVDPPVAMHRLLADLADSSPG